MRSSRWSLRETATFAYSTKRSRRNAHCVISLSESKTNGCSSCPRFLLWASSTLTLIWTLIEIQLWSYTVCWSQKWICKQSTRLVPFQAVPRMLLTLCGAWLSTTASTTGLTFTLTSSILGTSLTMRKSKQLETSKTSSTKLSFQEQFLD